MKKDRSCLQNPSKNVSPDKFTNVGSQQIVIGIEENGYHQVVLNNGKIWVRKVTDLTEFLFWIQEKQSQDIKMKSETFNKAHIPSVSQILLQPYNYIIIVMKVFKNQDTNCQGTLYL